MRLGGTEVREEGGERKSRERTEGEWRGGEREGTRMMREEEGRKKERRDRGRGQGSLMPSLCAPFSS